MSWSRSTSGVTLKLVRPRWGVAFCGPPSVVGMRSEVSSLVRSAPRTSSFASLWCLHSVLLSSAGARRVSPCAHRGPSPPRTLRGAPCRSQVRTSSRILPGDPGAPAFCNANPFSSVQTDWALFGFCFSSLLQDCAPWQKAGASQVLSFILPFLWDHSGERSCIPCMGIVSSYILFGCILIYDSLSSPPPVPLSWAKGTLIYHYK